jgi:WD40 repeat protein
VRRIIIHLRPAERRGGRSGEAQGVIGAPKLPFCDLRLFAAAAVAAIVFHILSKPDPAEKRGRWHVARGELGVQITSFALSPVNGLIATTNTAGRIALRAPESGWQIERLLDFPGIATEVACAPDGRSLASVGKAPGIYLWELDSPTSEPAPARLGSIEWPRHVMYAPDGQSLAVTSDRDGTIVIWDRATRSERVILHAPTPVVRLAFSPDGRWLATTGADDRSIQLWDLQTGSRRILLEEGPSLIMALAFSCDGAFLASAGSSEHYVRLWDLKTQKVCRVFVGHSRSVNSVAFSPDGSLLATAGSDGMLGLWTIETGQRLLSLESQATCLRYVAFSPDAGTLILATEDDDDIRFWDVAELLAASGYESQQLASVW